MSIREVATEICSNLQPHSSVTVLIKHSEYAQFANAIGAFQNKRITKALGHWYYHRKDRCIPVKKGKMYVNVFRIV